MQVQKNVLFSFFVISFWNSIVLVVIPVFHILTYDVIANKKNKFIQIFILIQIISAVVFKRSIRDKYLMLNQFLN